MTILQTLGRTYGHMDNLLHKVAYMADKLHNGICEAARLYPCNQ